jgi:hypothetical protein
MLCMKCNSEKDTGKRFVEGFVCIECLQPMPLKRALEVIMENKQAAALKWAVGYANFALEMLHANARPTDIRDQLLYLKGNITTWRNPQAKRVRDAVKTYIAEHANDY